MIQKVYCLIVNGILFFWARYFIITEHLAQQDDIGYTYRYLHMTNHLKPFCWSTLSHDSGIVAVLVANVSKNHSWIFFCPRFHGTNSSEKNPLIFHKKIPKTKNTLERKTRLFIALKKAFCPIHQRSIYSNRGNMGWTIEYWIKSRTVQQTF